MGVTLLLLTVGAVLAPTAIAAEDQGALLRRAARSDVPLSERLDAVKAVLEAETVEAPEAALRAAVALLDVAPEPACWLLKASADAAYVREQARLEVVTALSARILGEPGAALDPLVRARLTAAGLLFGLRPEEAAGWIAGALATGRPFLADVLAQEVGLPPLEPGTPYDPEGVELALRAMRDVASALDRAARDDLAVSRAGLAALRQMGAEALPVLLQETRLAATTFVPGRRERATRAILVLGFSEDRSATQTLIDALGSEDGWVRAYAATALGDLGDPLAVVALARQVTLLGDPLRDRNQWEYPGSQNTTVTEGDWPSAPYHAIDTQAADAMLRLGVRGAAGWLIHQQLDPRKKSYRIRVLQDATDAIKRSVLGAPIDGYNVDEGLPLRDRAFDALAAWWHAHRNDDQVLESELDPEDARFHEGAMQLAQVLAGPKVREMMMANAAVDLLGPLMTRALTETAKAPQSPFHKAEIAKALGRVSDPAAVPALLEILHDRTPFVRASAVVGLGPYARTNADVRAGLLKLMNSGNAAVRVAAMQALVHAPRDPDVRAAVDAWIAGDAARPEGAKWLTPDVRPAVAVLRFVQAGESAWPPIEAGLTHEQRVDRRTWWDLVRAALDVPEYLHDPVADPGTPWARTFARQAALAALDAGAK